MPSGNQKNTSREEKKNHKKKTPGSKKSQREKTIKQNKIFNNSISVIFNYYLNK